MRQQTAVADHLHEVGGDRLAGERLPGDQVPDLSGFRVHRQRIAGADPPCLRADESRQAEVEGVAVEKPGEGFGEERRDAEMLERRGRLLARDRKSTRLNSSHLVISYAVFCLKKKNIQRAEESDTRTRSTSRRNPS